MRNVEYTIKALIRRWGLNANLHIITQKGVDLDNGILSSNDVTKSIKVLALPKNINSVFSIREAETIQNVKKIKLAFVYPEKLNKADQITIGEDRFSIDEVDKFLGTSVWVATVSAINE